MSAPATPPAPGTLLTPCDPLAGSMTLVRLRRLLLSGMRGKLPNGAGVGSPGHFQGNRPSPLFPSDPPDDWMEGNAQRRSARPGDDGADADWIEVDGTVKPIRGRTPDGRAGDGRAVPGGEGAGGWDPQMTDDPFALELAGQLRLMLDDDDALLNALVPDAAANAPVGAGRGTPSASSSTVSVLPLVPPVTADEAMAATLLASALHRRLPLVRRLRAGRDARGVPRVGSDEVVLVRLGDMRLADAVWRALRYVVLGVPRPLDEADLVARAHRSVPPDRMAIGLVRRSRSTRSYARPDWKDENDDALVEALGHARATGLPTVVTIPLDDRALADKIRPLVDHEIVLADALGPSQTGAAIDLMVPSEPMGIRDRAPVREARHGTDGAPDPRRARFIGDGLEPERLAGKHPAPVRGLADLVTLDDLRASVSPRRGRRRSIARLQRTVARRFDGAGPGTDVVGTRAGGVGDGPGLEELAGYGRAKEFGLEIAADLRGYAEGRVPWSEIDRGLILCGPPGTGKTLFARALAQSAGAAFFAGSYSEWQRCGHLGDFLKAMNKTFEQARAAAPAVVLIDELDSFRRRAGGCENSDYLDQCVNALLQHLDGAITRDGVFVIGATNHPEQVDPAIVRSGRMERTLPVLPPDPDGMIELLTSLLGPDLAGLGPSPDATDDPGAAANDGSAGKASTEPDPAPHTDRDRLLLPLALRGAGASQADAAGWVRRARASARRAGRPLTLDDLAKEVAEGRPEPPPDLRRRVAIHEAGHAVAAVALGLGQVRSVYLTADGGCTELTPLREAGTRARVRRALAFLLSGREAERCILGDVSDGAGGGPQSDLARATTAAVAAVCAGGLGEGAPIWTLDADAPGQASAFPIGAFPTGALTHAISDERMAECAAMLAQAEADAAAIIATNRATVERMANELLTQHRLGATAVKELVKSVAVRAVHRRDVGV